jgi:hypothetical protein
VQRPFPPDLDHVRSEAARARIVTRFPPRRGSISIPEREKACDDPVMSDRLTESEYLRTAERLRGRRLTKVVYFLRAADESTAEPEQWDFDQWHLATRDVGLSTEDGGEFSAVWGISFDEYGIELYPEPMAAHVAAVGEPGGIAPVVVTGHPNWTGLAGKKLDTVEVRWLEEPGEPSLPVALRLGSGSATAWIAAAEPAAGPTMFQLCSDEVMVGFGAGFVTRLGLPG